MIDQKIKKAYSFYKNLYPIPIVMFHIGDYYCAYLGDARKIMEALHLDHTQFDDEIKVESEYISDFIYRCYERGMTVHLISHRNDFGEYEIPDVEILALAQEMDY